MSMAVYVIVAIVIILVVAVVTALAAGNVSVQKYKREEEAKVGNAEEKARVIIDEALKTEISFPIFASLTDFFEPTCGITIPQKQLTDFFAPILPACMKSVCIHPGQTAVALIRRSFNS